MKKKLLICLTIVIVITASTISFVLIKRIENNVKDDKVLYGEVVERKKDFLKLKTNDDEVIYVKVPNDLKTGDFIAVFYKTKKDFTKGEVSYDVIMEGEEDIVIPVITSTITTNIVTTISDNILEATSTNTTNQTNFVDNTSTTTTKVVADATDEEIISYIEETYEVTAKETLKEKAKRNFIMIVDFIFYDGEIKGRKFSELTSTAQARVLYYALLIDDKIDNKFPNYKDEIKGKYEGIKAKIVAKYMDITTSICNENEDKCENVKNDFALLKKSVNLTWSIIKEAFTHAYNTGKDALVDWYEMYSGKK